MNDSLPVLQGHWRLLEKHEKKCSGYCHLHPQAQEVTR